jgi:hypothetical protein
MKIYLFFISIFAINLNVKTKKMKNNILVKIVCVIIAGLMIDRCMFVSESKLIDKEISTFLAPIKSPFNHNVGIGFSVEETKWFSDPSIKYSQELQRQYTYQRLVKISKDFKLIRIYSFLIAGFEYTGTMSAEGYSLAKLAQQDKSIEAVLGTSCNRAWFLVPSNVQMYVDSIQSKFGTSISQVKTILIGNEINANSYSKSDIATIMSNFKVALKKNKLNIPVTVTFSNLPNQKGDALSDSLVAAVVNNWDTTWNSNKPFVFIDPYPDAAGINNAAGVYNWQYDVTRYYQNSYPSLQIFIGETGAEGSTSDYATTVVIDSLLSQLTVQYDSVGKTVPTLLFEAVNEPLKIGEPNQKFMGIYFDSSVPSKTNVKLKEGIVLPAWMK